MSSARSSYSASASFFIPEGGTGYGTIDLPPYESYAVSGTMTGDEQPIVGMQVRLEGQAYRETQTDEAGAYSVVVPKGYYEIYLSKTGGSGLEEPANIYCERYDTYVSAPLDFGYAFTWHRVSGRVTNAAGVPIGGVTVNSSSWVDLGNDAYCYTYWSGQTADDGSYSFLAMQGQTSYSFVPKAGSGYKSINLSSNLTGDLTQQVVLQLPDIVSPNLLGDPVVIHHSNTSVSIQWGTNEATNGRLEYEEGATLDGAAVVIDKPAYVTDHIVTLRDLAPLTEYAYRVTSKDAAGNAVTSGILTFTTVELPDVEAPVITAGPTVTFLAPTQIRVSWQTNEPATSWIDYGLAGGARDLTKGGDESALLHDVLLTGLTPETTYSLVVRSSDPDGNGPTASAPFDVTTPAVSDTTAPTVTNLRTECVTHERMAVCWDTDEPATSNVAYENQSTQVAGGISSGALVTSRCMALTGLSAATS
ncbi:MAG: hypothetical protein DYH12_36415, partial [Sorangiineae bacterium PRO1]|nr:hypothetical protein [Sorangiineae bacterium PRO1]